jgi:hypothetical protein
MPLDFQGFTAAIERRLAEILLAAIVASFVVVFNLWVGVRDIERATAQCNERHARVESIVRECGTVAACQAVDERVRGLERDVARLSAKAGP